MLKMAKPIANAIKDGSKFAFFPQLPNEISVMIVNHALALEGPRIIPIMDYPYRFPEIHFEGINPIATSLLHAFALSRFLAQKRYSVALLGIKPGKDYAIYVDWKQDTIFVDSLHILTLIYRVHEGEFFPRMNFTINWQQRIQHLAIGSSADAFWRFREMVYHFLRNPYFLGMIRLRSLKLECRTDADGLPRVLGTDVVSMEKIREALLDGKPEDEMDNEELRKHKYVFGGEDVELDVLNEVKECKKRKKDEGVKIKWIELGGMESLANDERLARMHETSG